MVQLRAILAPVRRSGPARSRSIAGLLFAAVLIGLAGFAAGCQTTPELRVPAQEIRFWPADHYDDVRAHPDQRCFVPTQLPPQIFFRAGEDCGAVENLSISIAGWAPNAPDAPGASAPATSPSGDANAGPPRPDPFAASGEPPRPPDVRWFLTDRHARANARFEPSTPLSWETGGGREVIELRATPAGISPTPVRSVVFHLGWLYRLTFLARLPERSFQRTIWIGPTDRLPPDGR
ncbi:MAG: hypothetical protein ACREJ2_01285 [Planctomycetota bacterium]